MKVLHIITCLYDGGAEGVLYRLCSTDNSCNHTVVSLMDEGKYASLLNDIGVEVHCLNMKPSRLSFGGIIKLYKIIKKTKPNVVQTWMYHADLIGGLVARISGVHNVVWGVRHTTLVKGESKYTTILIARINAFLSYFIPKKIIYCALKSREVQESLGFKRSKGLVVPNGYNINDFQPSQAGRSRFRKELFIEDDVFLIGHVGRYDPQKDHENLIKAIVKLDCNDKKFKVVLVGSNLDTSNNELNKIIHNYDLIDEFILMGKRTDIFNIMNGFDLFVLSSSSEGFPNVLAEAMACGTPCITTDVGDASVIVGTTGWVVPPKDPHALANAILQAIQEKTHNHQAWIKRKQACRNRIVENFGIERMVANYHQVWFCQSIKKGDVF
jgi:glycosyltransferase involved in cell wall biosynthesis